MGKDRVIDKSITPQQVIYSLTPALAVEGRARGSLGVVPIGYFRGEPRFWDLDLANVQPLVLAEQLHVLGVLNGGTEDHDKQTVAVAVALAAYSGTLTVPAGEVWFLTAVESILPASGNANIITGNWHCSLWTDPAAVPSTHGQPFHAEAFDFGKDGGTQFDEFSPPAVWWVITNKPYPLRLPAGTVLTFVATNTGAAVLGAAVSAVFNIYGFIGKALVD